VNQPLSPIDLARLEPGSVVNVAGRILATTPNTLTLGDAFGSCLAVCSGPSPAVGSWATVSGVVSTARGELREAVVLNHSPGRLLADGYFARFARMGRHLAARAVAAGAVRAYFAERRFVEVSTPMRVTAPGTDVYLEPQPSEERWLITSPEFHHKRLLAGGLPRIFELAHCTRKGERGPWHHPEFTMLEWYQTFTSADDLMAQTEALVVHLATALGVGPSITVQERKVTLDQPFARLTVAQAFAQYASIDDVTSLATHDEDTYFQLMVDKVEPAIARSPIPVFLTHYPESQAALAKRSSTFPGFAERFELFIAGVELCNGYGELTDADEQAARFAHDVERRAAKGLPPLPVDQGLVDALREGIPPCSGNAVGFDRLVAVLLQQPLDEVVAFAP
jgi:elongation factor P--(R)-beta-lysine ligase